MFSMEMILSIAHHILLIGGALCVVLFFLILLYILHILMKAKRLLTNAERTYHHILMTASLPLRALSSWLGGGDDEDEGDEDVW